MAGFFASLNDEHDRAFSVARSVLTPEMAARFRVWLEAAICDQSPYPAAISKLMEGIRK